MGLAEPRICAGHGMPCPYGRNAGAGNNAGAEARLI